MYARKRQRTQVGDEGEGRLLEHASVVPEVAVGRGELHDIFVQPGDPLGHLLPRALQAGNGGRVQAAHNREEAVEIVQLLALLRKQAVAEGVSPVSPTGQGG